MSSSYSIFKPKVIEEVTSIILDETIDITTDIEKQSSIFVRNEKIFAEMTFKVTRGRYLRLETQVPSLVFTSLNRISLVLFV